MNLPYKRENAAVDAGPLPELLKFDDGSLVKTVDDWRRRRVELAGKIIELEYGGMPTALPPEATTIDCVSVASAERRFGIKDSGFLVYCVKVSGGLEPVHFLLNVWKPKGKGPFPVILNGDGCWSYFNDKVGAELLSRGFAVAQFNRCELAHDDEDARESGIYHAFPGEYGAISAWAWGYHRAYDALIQMPFVDPKRVAITGHSRGGKTVELAGATDERIAAVGDNNSGCCGFSAHRVHGEDGETIADIAKVFPFWFKEGFISWAGREGELPFDQHFLSALIAPRPLLFAVANGDDWSNQIGACVSAEEVAKVYGFLGAGDKFGITFRDGPHGHDVGDWIKFAEFALQRL